jgi:hypothetical protein
MTYMLEYVFYLLWCDNEADHGMTSFVRNTVSIILKKMGTGRSAVSSANHKFADLLIINYFKIGLLGLFETESCSIL